MDHRRRFGRVGLMMTLVVTSVLTASAQTTELRATEGDWSGFVSFVGNNIPFQGSFEFVSAAGELEAGKRREPTRDKRPDQMPDF